MASIVASASAIALGRQDAGVVVDGSVDLGVRERRTGRRRGRVGGRDRPGATGGTGRDGDQPGKDAEDGERRSEARHGVNPDAPVRNVPGARA